MNVTYRRGTKDDCQKIAELDYIASEGAIEYLFHDLVPNMSAIQVVNNGLAQDVYPHSFRSAIVAEIEKQVVGMTLSYPAKLHRITEELKAFLPKERLEHFEDFYSSRVDGSYLLDALCVFEKHRKKGIGKSLLIKTMNKARDEGYNELSLIVFSDNQNAINFYKTNAFETVKSIKLLPHQLLPHEGGCMLMKRAL